MPSFRIFLGIIFVLLVTGCSQSAKPIRVPGLPVRAGQTFTVLPVADYSYIADVESAYRRQIAAQVILSTILEYYGYPCTSQQEVDRYLIEAGYIKSRTFDEHIKPAADTTSLENLLNENWSAMMKSEIVGLYKEEKKRNIPGLANQDNHLAAPETKKLDARAIIGIGQEFTSDYTLRARLLEYDLRQEYEWEPLRRSTLSFLRGENRTLQQFSVARATHYDTLDNLFIGGELIDLGPKKFHGLRLQLWVQDNVSGEVVWTEQIAYPIVEDNFNRAYAEATDALLTNFFIQVAIDGDGDGIWDHRDRCPGTPAVVPVDAAGCALDSDGDGVADYLDTCPETPATAPVDENGCPLDSDGDGIADYLDDCPETPENQKVNRLGCPQDADGDTVPDSRDKCPDTPPGVAVDTDGCPLDSDGDGVADEFDECPQTPAGILVDLFGCPPDSDGDGVADDLDACPGTLAGFAVDSRGCPEPLEEEASVELRIQFDFDKAEIKPVYHEELEKVASFLLTYPETEALIEGHTDSEGDEAYNLRLSQLRAETVKLYLANQFGIDPARLQARGFGQDRPVAANETPAGREKNRRSVAVISTTTKN